MNAPRPRPAAEPARARTRRGRRPREIFLWPTAIGIAGVVGLVSGLTGEGLRDLAAWLLVGIAPAVIIVALRARPRLSPSASKQKDFP